MFEIIKNYITIPLLLSAVFYNIMAAFFVLMLSMEAKSALVDGYEWKPASLRKLISLDAVIIVLCGTYFYGIWIDEWKLNHLRFPSEENYYFALIATIGFIYSGFRIISMLSGGFLKEKDAPSANPQSAATNEHPFGAMKNPFVDVKYRKVTKTVTCPDCEGRGMKVSMGGREVYEEWPCSACGGYTVPSRHIMAGYYSKEKNVPGSGRIDMEVDVRIDS